MTRLWRFRWVVLFFVFLLAGGSVFWILRWNSEENAVYEATIHEAFNDVGVSSYVVLDTTVSGERVGISRFHARRLGLPFSAAASYTAKNFFRYRIPPTMPLPHPRVSQQDIDEACGPSRVTSARKNRPNRFLQQTGGVITLSRVGFDASGKHAVVYAQLTYCGLYGEGAYLYLSKESGTWHIVGNSIENSPKLYVVEPRAPARPQ
jgi:hypothetical protein